MNLNAIEKNTQKYGRQQSPEKQRMAITYPWSGGNDDATTDTVLCRELRLNFRGNLQNFHFLHRSTRWLDGARVGKRPAQPSSRLSQAWRARLSTSALPQTQPRWVRRRASGFPRREYDRAPAEPRDGKHGGESRLNRDGHTATALRPQVATLAVVARSR
jgi:hypothetical protein